MAIKVSIRTKIIAVTCALLALSVLVYSAMATVVFKRDKTALVFDLNNSAVTNISSEVESVISAVSGKMELFALLSSRPQDLENLQSLFHNDSHLVFLSLKSLDGQPKHLHYLSPTYSQSYGLSEEYFQRELPQEVPPPLEAIEQEGQAIWRAATATHPLLVGVGRQVIQEDQHGVPVARYAVLAYVSLAKVVDLISGPGRTNDIKIVNRQGEILAEALSSAHPVPSGSVAQWSLFQKALESPLARSVLTYEDEALAGEALGAYAKSYGDDLITLSRVSAESAFSVVRTFVLNSFLFAMVFLILGTMMAVILSTSLTRPLSNLVEGMQKVTEGALDTQIELKSKDETALLANSFNVMIQELKSSQEQLEEINRDLEQKVKDRTAKLEEQNLAVKNAQEALLRTTRLASAGEIAGRAAHEILNPLTSMMARVRKVRERIDQSLKENAQFLKELQQSWEEDFRQGNFERLIDTWKKPSEVLEGATIWQEDQNFLQETSTALEQACSTLQEDMQFLVSESHRINKIVQSMRSLSSVQSVKHNLSAHKLLTESVHIMADLFDQDDIKVELQLEASQDRVLVDSDEVLQSVTNLLRNSLQAIKEVRGPGEGRVLLRTRNEEGKILVEILDNGAGVQEELKSRLFEAQISTKSRDEGTGLGLSIARRFIRAFGGDLYYDGSREDWTTVFKMELPLAPAVGSEVAA